MKEGGARWCVSIDQPIKIYVCLDEYLPGIAGAELGRHSLAHWERDEADLAHKA